MLSELKSTLRPSLAMVVLFTVLTGALYPIAIWIVTHDLFAYEAEGSLVHSGDQVVGSELLGQSFTAPRYLWGRLSGAANGPYHPAVSSGSNLGPLNPALLDAAGRRIKALRAADPGLSGPIPVDLVTASASGLDPDVSPAGARAQVARIAAARGVDPAMVRALIDRHVEGPSFGFLGEPRVNVLAVNLALDRELAGVVY